MSGVAGRRARLALLLVAVLSVAFMLLAPRIPQDPAYHDFADRRPWLGVPNAGDVLGNLAFLPAGLAGLLVLRRRAAAPEPAARAAWAVFFAGVLLTTFGSAYYHLAPENPRLAWDRLCIALGLPGMLCAVIAERVPAPRAPFGRSLDGFGKRDARLRAAQRRERHSGARSTGLRRPEAAAIPFAGSRRNSLRWVPRLAALTLPALLLFSVGSVAWWARTEAAGDGDLRAYAVAQFGLALALVLLAMLAPSREGGRTDLLWGVIGFYAAAKVCEALDRPIFALGGIVSGHTLKHLFAAAAAAWAALALRRRVTS